jgi:hypothetical protein
MWDKRSDERHYFSIMADEFVATGTAGDEEWHLEGTFHNFLDFNSQSMGGGTSNKSQSL